MRIRDRVVHVASGAGGAITRDRRDSALRKGSMLTIFQQVAQEQGIRSMPTFRVFKDGKAIDEIVGAVPAKLTVSLKLSLV